MASTEGFLQRRLGTKQPSVNRATGEMTLAHGSLDLLIQVLILRYCTGLRRLATVLLKHVSRG